MAYGREQLRKAGQAIQRFDDAYSQKIEDMYAHGPVSGLAIAGGAVPTFRKLDAGGTPEQREQMNPVLLAAIERGIPVANAVPKYVLPAAGVGLAVQGVSSIVDAARGVNQQSEGTAGF